jgi:hypothetical protein
MDVTTAIDEAVSAVLNPTVPVVAKPAPAAPVEEELEAPTDALEPEHPEGEGEPEPDEEEAPVGPELPEGYVAPGVVTEGLATQFVLYDQDGEVEVPDLMVKYQANGKERNDRLDQVVKLAQWGAYNQERDQKAKQIEQQYTTVKAEADELAETLAEREAQLERLLQDDDFLFAAREAYERENSPERRAERADERAKAAEVNAQLAPIVAEGQRFYTQEVGPALARIAQVLPTITAEELDQRMALAMQAHAQVGPHGQPIVTPAKYDALRQYIVEDLAVWAKAMHEYRSTGKVGAPMAAMPTPAKPSPELARAQREAQKAKNTIARAIKPSGGAATKETRRGTKAQASSSVDDALAAAMDSVLANIPQ